MPTTTGFATDLITFSRGSLATVTDSNGYIKWAPHNLVAASEQFDNASIWNLVGSGVAAPTLTANASTAPNGTTTAEELALPSVTAAGDVSIVATTLSLPVAQYSIGLWVKAKAAGDIGKQVVVYSFDGSNFAIKVHTTLDGTWQYVTGSGTPGTTSPSFTVGVVGSTYGGVNQGAVSIYLWGAHLYRSDLGGMQANASAYPMYNPSTPKNLLGYSEAFDNNSGWVKIASSVTANAVAAPNGSLSADKIVEDTSTGSHGVYNTPGLTSVSGTPYVYSVYAKAAERSFVIIDAFTNTNARTWFNLSNGTVGTNASGSTASIESVGNGWYRCTVIRSSTSAASGTQFLGVYAASADNVSSYTGDGTSGIYLWGAQLSDSASLDPYVGSYGAAPSPAAAYGPRLDYDPSTLAAKGLLVEEQRTNLQTYSNVFSNAAWTKTEATLNANNASSPDGSVTAAQLLDNTSNAEHNVYGTATLTAAAYTFSVYLKNSGVGYARVSLATASAALGVGVFVNLNTGTLGSTIVYGGAAGTASSITAVGNGWYRVSVTVTGTAATYYPAVTLILNGSTTVYAGDGTKGAYLYGAQLEANASFATSYIPTAAATVTRNADVASVATSQFPYSATEGSIVANVTPLNVAAASRAVQIDDGTENERYTLSTNSTPNGLFTVIDGGSSQAAIATGTPAANTNIKLAARYKVNDFALSVNGGAASTDTSGTLPIANLLMRLGSGTLSTEPLNGHIRQITYIPRALTNAELTARSA